MSDFDDKFKKAADAIRRSQIDKTTTTTTTTVPPLRPSNDGQFDDDSNDSTTTTTVNNTIDDSDQEDKKDSVDKIDDNHESGDDFDNYVDGLIESFIDSDGLTNEEVSIIKYSVDNHLVEISASDLSFNLGMSIEDTIDALDKLTTRRLVTPPSGLDSNYTFTKLNDTEIKKVLTNNNDITVADHDSDSKGSSDDPKPMISKSLYDQLKSAESKETKGLFSIATGAIDPRAAVEAHDMMNTSDQVKAFMTQQIRVELTRMVKLSETMARLEDQYIDNAMSNLGLMSQEALETTMAALDRSMTRASGLIDKYYGDPDLSMFIQDAMVSNSTHDTNGVHSTISRESREKIRNMATRMLTMIDNNPAKIIDASELDISPDPDVTTETTSQHTGSSEDNQSDSDDSSEDDS